MRRLAFLLLTLSLVLAACDAATPTPVATEPTPVSTTVYTDPAPGSTGTPETIQAYACLNTRVTFLNGDPISYSCDLASQEGTYTFFDGTIVRAALFVTPAPVEAGQPVTITAYARTDSQEGACVLVDTQTGNILTSNTLVPTDDMTIQANCQAWDKHLLLEYQIRVIPPGCAAELIWESVEPSSITVGTQGFYLVEVRFPLVTGDHAWWIHNTAWFEVNRQPAPITFTGAVGKVYRFHGECTGLDRQNWIIHHLTTPPGSLENYRLAGVVQ